MAATDGWARIPARAIGLAIVMLSPMWACDDDDPGAPAPDAGDVTLDAEVEPDATDIEDDEVGTVDAEPTDADIVEDSGRDAVPDAGDGQDGADGDAADDSGGNDASEDAPLGADASETGAFLNIVVAGLLEDRSPDDGLAAQTPVPYHYGLQRLEMLRSASDPNPEVIFDYAPDFVMVDMHDKTTVARVPMSELPESTFTHFRIVLSLVEVEVDATLHEVPSVGTYEARLQILYALSDIETESLTLGQGDAEISTTVVAYPFDSRQHWDVTYPSPAPDAWAESVDSKTTVTFLLSPAIDVSSASTEDLTYVINYYVHDSFRWQDQDEPGYTDKQWDITVGTPASAEPVLRMGANDYEVVTE